MEKRNIYQVQWWKGTRGEWYVIAQIVLLALDSFRTAQFSRMDMVDETLEHGKCGCWWDDHLDWSCPFHYCDYSSWVWLAYARICYHYAGIFR